MSPEQISVLTSLVALVKTLSTWPVISIIFLMVIGPWVMAMMLFYSTRKRFETVVSMYENNVRLVEKYEKIACDLKDVIILNTQSMTTLVELIRRIK